MHRCIYIYIYIYKFKCLIYLLYVIQQPSFISKTLIQNIKIMQNSKYKNSIITIFSHSKDNLIKSLYILATLAKIRTINLKKRDLNGLKLINLGRIYSNSRHIRSIILDFNEIGRESNALISFLRGIIHPPRTLDRISLIGVSLTPATLRQMLVLAENAQLGEMNLSFNRMSGSKIWNPMRKYLPTAQKLRKLDISYNNLSGIGIHEICRGIVFQHILRELNISNSALDDEDSEIIQLMLSAQSQLRIISFQGNLFTDKGINRIFKGIRGNSHTKLKYINMGNHPKLTDNIGGILGGSISTNQYLHLEELAISRCRNLGLFALIGLSLALKREPPFGSLATIHFDSCSKYISLDHFTQLGDIISDIPSLHLITLKGAKTEFCIERIMDKKNERERGGLNKIQF